MTKPTRTTFRRPLDRLVVGVDIIIILTCIIMLMPIHMGLSAGIAAVSVIVFTAAIVISLFLVWISNGRARVVTWVALSASVVGLCVPQLGYIMTADKHGVSLHFDPVTYVTFSGETHVQPTSKHIYKAVGRESLRLAFYASPLEGPRPIVAILHGGGWRYGNYLQNGNWPEVLTRAGLSVITIDYRLSSPERHTWHDTPQDINDALVFIKKNATKFRLASDHLHVLGQSAGGHLALLEAYRHHNVRSVVSLYAPVDLELDYDTSRDKSAELVFLGGTPEELPARYHELSPLTYVSPEAPATLILQGTRDDLVAHENASILEQKLTDNGVPHSLIRLPLTGHSFENQHGGFATQIAEQTVINFLNRQR